MSIWESPEGNTDSHHGHFACCTTVVFAVYGIRHEQALQAGRRYAVDPAILLLLCEQ